MKIQYVILLALSLTFLLGSGGNFREYGGNRTVVYNITDNGSSFVAFSCPPGTLEARKGDKLTVLTLVNNLNEDAEFYITSEPDVLEFNNPTFVSSGDSANIQATYTGEGSDTAYLTVDATWDGGSAKVETCLVNIATPRFEIEKVLLDGKERVKVGVKEYWTYRINLRNYGDDELLTVKDTVPAEFEIVSYTPSSGNVTVTQSGNGKGASKILWTVNVKRGETEYLDVRISTKLNPAGKQEFTSPGKYYINNGAEIVGYDITSNNLRVIAEEW